MKVSSIFLLNTAPLVDQQSQRQWRAGEVLCKDFLRWGDQAQLLAVENVARLSTSLADLESKTAFSLQQPQGASPSSLVALSFFCSRFTFKWPPHSDDSHSFWIVCAIIHDDACPPNSTSASPSDVDVKTIEPASSTSAAAADAPTTTSSLLHSEHFMTLVRESMLDFQRRVFPDVNLAPIDHLDNWIFSVSAAFAQCSFGWLLDMERLLHDAPSRMAQHAEALKSKRERLELLKEKRQSFGGSDGIMNLSRTVGLVDDRRYFERAHPAKVSQFWSSSKKMSSGFRWPTLSTGNPIAETHRPQPNEPTTRLLFERKAVAPPAASSSSVAVTNRGEGGGGSRGVQPSTEYDIPLSSLFQGLDTLVIDQGTVIDSIDHNIPYAKDYVENGVQELRAAEEYQRKSGVIGKVWRAATSTRKKEKRQQPQRHRQRAMTRFASRTNNYDAADDGDHDGAEADLAASSRKAEERLAARARKKQRRREKPKVDDVFADMENAFNGMSAVLYAWRKFLLGECLDSACDNICSCYFLCCCCVGWPFPLLGVLLLYVVLFGFSLLVILPACFVLLLVRTAVVERKVENFAARQQVLQQETVEEKSARFVNLLLRALPMAFLLIGYPIIAVYLIIPHYDKTVRTANVALGVYICIIVVFQILGTIRSTFAHEDKRTQLIAKHASTSSSSAGVVRCLPPPTQKIEAELVPVITSPTFKMASTANLMTATTAADETTHLTAAPLRTVTVQAHLSQDVVQQQLEELAKVEQTFQFRWRNVGNWLAILTLVIETFQLATFAVQTLNYSQTTGGGSSTDSVFGVAPAAQGWISCNLMPILFVDVVRILSHNIHLVYGWGAIGVCALLVTVFLLQFLRELRLFGENKAQGRAAYANTIFFYSFVGSIIYGHGEMRRVGPKLTALVTVLSDTLFLVVCSKLMLVLTCVESSDPLISGTVLLINPSVVCWTGSHNAIAVCALISFGFYLPLAAMVAPMMTESPEKVTEGFMRQGKKDIGYIKPYLAVITVAKCAMIVAGTFFGQEKPVATVVATAICMFLLFLISVIWTFKPAASSLLVLEKVEGTIYLPLLQRVNGGLGEPCYPPAVNIWRSLSFLGGVWGAIVAIAAYEHPDKLGGDAKFGLLLAGFGVIFTCGVGWYRKWWFDSSSGWGNVFRSPEVLHDLKQSRASTRTS